MTIPERQTQESELLLPLSTIRLNDLSRVGGKAAQLGELIAAGLPVPQGFVITTEAWNRFVESDQRIRAWLENAESHAQEPAALRTAVSELRQRLEEITMPEDVTAVVVLAMGLRPDAARVVRSSATVEDSPEASFAGQHDSFLNVRGADAVMSALKRCWISLFSERAVTYRKRKNISSGQAQMAVIIQEMIPSEVSGVMFTIDPIGAAPDSILIEAAFGLGEAVVQGRVTPDRVVVSRSTMRVLSRETGIKRVQVIATENGVSEQPLGAGKSAAPALDDQTAARLGKLGLAAERLLVSYNESQIAGSEVQRGNDGELSASGGEGKWRGGRSPGGADIEWGLCQGKLWLFQARPITTTVPLRRTTFEDRQVWTNANTGEVLPDVVTPMTWSVVLPSTRVLAEHLLGIGGFAGIEEQFVSLIAGRAYFNFNAFCAVGRRLPGLRKRKLEEILGGRQEFALALQNIRLTEADLPRIDVSWWRVGAGLLTLVLPFVFYQTQQGEKAIEFIRRANDELACIEPGALSDEQLLALIQSSSTPAALRSVKAVRAFGFGMAYLLLLYELCEKWFGKDGRTRANRLLAGVGEMDSAVTGHELWELAELAAAAPEMKSRVMTVHHFNVLAARLGACPGGAEFLARWNAFMHRHGHHARGEIELFNPRWSECPDLVLNILRGYVEAIDTGHLEPGKRRQLLARERGDLANQSLRELKSPLKRFLFRLCLRRAQNGSRFRENVKSEAVRELALLRRFLLELGRRLAEQKRLADANDVFFLKTHELHNEALSSGTSGWQALVAERRACYEQNVKIHPPSVIFGRFDPRTFLPDKVVAETKVFYGIGVSSGKVTGPARVLLRLDHERVEPGEILVAPFTDPGWTPYFVAAAGIVMDLGGLLSHGSIVAREYGIPAVVNVGPATQIIRTGQWLEVDADCGVVRVLDAI